ncbi:MAG: hypothetical protein Ct9H300mP14_02730 [Gammaproteobacteria bacterium]|nr:MAG: hypothetical protein Ct9H300mP14_02730 [Gammaproteobacteria bacterium]
MKAGLFPDDVIAVRQLLQFKPERRDSLDPKKGLTNGKNRMTELQDVYSDAPMVGIYRFWQ